MTTPPTPPAAPPGTTPVPPTTPAPPAPAPPQNTPPAPDPPTPPPAIGPDGKLGDNWFLSLGDEFAPHAVDLGKHKDIRSLITELNYFRKAGVEYPVLGSSEEVVGRWKSIAKVPDAPEGYNVSAEGLPEGVVFDAELAAAITKAAHGTHTPPASVQAMAKAFNDVISKRMADSQAADAKLKQDAQDALVAEWRGDFESNASTVRHITNKLAEVAGLPAEDPAIVAMSSTPAFARIMLATAKALSEDGTRVPTGYGDLRSPADRIRDIESGTDPVWGKKYREGTTDERLAAYEYVAALREKANL